MFRLPRSSWADYDAKLISAGGGVHPRSAKSIALTPEVKKTLGVAADALTPTELVNAILKAPVDLLYNGGIGTYVKAHSESHAQVGDRANDALRVDGRELRCKVVAEGGNFLDASNWERDASMFADHLHLTEEGAVRFSQALGQRLRDTVKLDAEK